jgi:uncharacterized protein
MGATALQVEPWVGQDFYVPYFEILIRGRSEPELIRDILSVNFTDSLKEIDSFEIIVNNWDPNGRNGSDNRRGWFKYSDGDKFDPWQDVELWMGYYVRGTKQRRCMLIGEIVRMTPNFPQSGSSTLTVHCVGLLHRFRTAQIDKNYTRKKDSWIARELVREIAGQVRAKIPGLTLKVDDAEIDKNLKNETEIEHLTIKQEYAINFLHRRSREIGYEFTMEERETGASNREVTFHYRPPNAVTRTVYRLEWGKSLLSFQPSFSTAEQVTEVYVRSWDPQTKKTFEGRARRADLLRDGVLDPTEDFKVRQGPLAERIEIVTDEIVQSQEEATQRARQRLRSIAQGLIEGRGKTIGLPDLRAGCKVEIAGIGRYDGNYVVTGTTHSISDSGYTTDFNARKEK